MIRTLKLVTADDRTVTVKADIDPQIDKKIQESASYGLNAEESQALIEQIFADDVVETNESLAALALAAGSQLGDSIKKILYTAEAPYPGSTEAEAAETFSPFELRLTMHESTAEKTGKTLAANLKDSPKSELRSGIQQVLKGNIPKAEVLQAPIDKVMDADLARDIRDHLDRLGNELDTNDAYKITQMLRSSTAVGPETMTILKHVIADAHFDDIEGWYSLRAALQEHYPGSIHQHMSPHAIVNELYTLAAQFESSYKSISSEEGAKLLTIGTMEGIPSLEVRRALHDIVDRYDFTPAAQKAYQTYLGNLPYQEPKEWTMFVHMSSENNLEEFGLDDVNEMESRFGEVAKFMNIVVLADGNENSYWGTVGDAPGYNWKSKSRLLLIEHDPYQDDRGVVSKEIPIPNNSELGKLMLENNGELNLASGQTLRAALDFAMKAVPSDKVFVDLWNHGAAWEGVASDDSSPYHGDLIRLDELRDALTDLPKKVDVIGFDACLMQNLGVAAVLEQADIDYVVASEETEPGEGWAYENFLSTLSENHEIFGKLSPEKLASSLVQSYDGPTLSAMRLDTMPAMQSSLEKLGSELLNMGGRGNAEISDAINRAQRFRDSDLVDAVDLCNHLQKTLDPKSGAYKAAQRLKILVRDAIVENHTSGAYSDSHGLTMYLPRSGHGFDDDFLTNSQLWIKDCPKWLEFLRSTDRPPAVAEAEQSAADESASEA